jgi:hypothetical protein
VDVAFTLLIFSVSRRPSPNQSSRRRLGRRKKEKKKKKLLSSSLLLFVYPSPPSPPPFFFYPASSIVCCSILSFSRLFASFSLLLFLLHPLLFRVFSFKENAGGGQFVRGLSHSLPSTPLLLLLLLLPSPPNI